MRGEPPEKLTSLLERLHLATRGEVLAMRPRVRRLTGELPDFESAWVDALAQARHLTPYQASELNTGRGELLACGPYVLERPLPSPHYAECFAARSGESKRHVRLYLVRRSQVPAAAAASRLAAMCSQLSAVRGPNGFAIEETGHQGDLVWAACAPLDGTTAADWMAENGRFPPEIALHIAHEMVARLAVLARFSQPHGDIGAAGLILQSNGRVALPMPGLRGVVRPFEGYSFNDLQPQAYDYLAPERIAAGTPPTPASDLYACGCLWWHLLTGRAPFGGGNSLARLKSAHAARLTDVRRLAPEVSDRLAGAIEQCVARDPAARPGSLEELSKLLGAPERSRTSVLASCLNQQPSQWRFHAAVQSRPGPLRKRPVLAAATAITLAALLLGLRGRALRRPAAPSSVMTASVAHRAPGALPASTPSTDRKTPDHGLPDGKVALATAIDSSAPSDLVLGADVDWTFEPRALQAGQRVRGPAGERARVTVPRDGLVVDVEDVTFEGIDFVCEVDRSARNNDSPGPPARRSRDDDGAEEPAAMIVVEARAAQWRSCSFSSPASSKHAAIRWQGPGDWIGQGPSELSFRDCVASKLSAVVDCADAGDRSLGMTNMLCIDSGPILRLRGVDARGARVSIALEHTTLRAKGAVLEWRDAAAREPHLVAISVIASALHTQPGGGLLVFKGAERPDPLLRTITWSGEGSLIAPDTALALWSRPSGKAQVIADDQLEVAGLVRGRLEFAGDNDRLPEDSRLLRWQAPLRSPEAPGIDAARLCLPRN